MTTSAVKFGQIADYAFRMHMMDLDTLRNKVQRQQKDLPRSFVNGMKRNDLINAAIADEFGNDAVMDYIMQTKQHEENEKFVNGKS